MGGPLTHLLGTVVSFRPAPLWMRICVVVVGLVLPTLAISASGAATETQKWGRVVSEGPVTPMHRPVGPANNSPKLAVHPEDEDFLALSNRLDAPGFGCALHVSGDGGASWVPVEPLPRLPAGAEGCYAPQIAFGPDGTLYFLFVGLSGEGNTPMGVFLTRSEDGGRSFTKPEQIFGELKFGVRLAVDRGRGEAGRLHLVWIDANQVRVGGFGPPPNPVMSSHSDDGGKSWSEPVRVSDPDRQRVVAPVLDVGPDGDVYVAYYDLLDDVRDYQGMQGPVWPGEWELVLASAPDGESFGTGEVVAEVSPHERVMLIFTAAPPALAAGDDGQLCLAWADEGRGHGDVIARCRPADGAGWHETARVNDTGEQAESTQELPQIAIAPDGRIDVVFQDGRRPPGDEFIDMFYAASTDGGRTFTTNHRVSGHSSYTGFGPRYGAIDSAAGMIEFGSQLALFAREDGAVAAWPDTRNANQRSQGQTIFAATIAEVPRGPNASVLPGWATPVLVGVALVAGAAFLGSRRRRDRTSDQAVTGQPHAEAGGK